MEPTLGDLRVQPRPLDQPAHAAALRSLRRADDAVILASG
jgi:hypothetical protein